MSGWLWRLQVPGQALRGAYVSLGEDWPALVRARNHGPDAAALLGQALAAMPLLTAHLKTQARLSLQISQAPPLQLLIAQAGSDGTLRGMIRVDGEALDPAALEGRLSVTLEPAGGGQRFQGLVSLAGSGPADWLARYFERSEQVSTCLLLRADQRRAAGMMLQALPGEACGSEWQAAMQDLDVDSLPDEPGEWLSTMLGFDLRMGEQAQPVAIRCRCSRRSVGAMLLRLGRNEVDQVLEEQGQIAVECGFCGQDHVFDAQNVEDLFAADGAEQQDS